MKLNGIYINGVWHNYITKLPIGDKSIEITYYQTTLQLSVTHVSRWTRYEAGEKWSCLSLIFTKDVYEV